MVYSAKRFVLCLALCYFVLVFFSPFSIAITSLGEEIELILVLLYVCSTSASLFLFSVPLSVYEGLRFVILAHLDFYLTRFFNWM